MSSGKAFNGGNSTLPVITTSSPPRRRKDGLGALPLTTIFFCSMSCCTRTRLMSGNCETSHWSRRAPRTSTGTVSVCIGEESDTKRDCKEAIGNQQSPDEVQSIFYSPNFGDCLRNLGC